MEKPIEREFTPQMAWSIIANNLRKGYLSMATVKVTPTIAQRIKGIFK